MKNFLAYLSIINDMNKTKQEERDWKVKWPLNSDVSGISSSPLESKPIKSDCREIQIR